MFNNGVIDVSPWYRMGGYFPIGLLYLFEQMAVGLSHCQTRLQYVLFDILITDNLLAVSKRKAA